MRATVREGVKGEGGLFERTTTPRRMASRKTPTNADVLIEPARMISWVSKQAGGDRAGSLQSEARIGGLTAELRQSHQRSYCSRMGEV
jgi:hypothetical protein